MQQGSQRALEIQKLPIRANLYIGLWSLMQANPDCLQCVASSIPWLNRWPGKNSWPNNAAERCTTWHFLACPYSASSRRSFTHPTLTAWGEVHRLAWHLDLARNRHLYRHFDRHRHRHHHRHRNHVGRQPYPCAWPHCRHRAGPRPHVLCHPCTCRHDPRPCCRQCWCRM